MIIPTVLYYRARILAHGIANISGTNDRRTSIQKARSAGSLGISVSQFTAYILFHSTKFATWFDSFPTADFA